MKKNILILATGGTIAGESYESYYKAGIKAIDSITSLLPREITQNVNIFSKQICNIDSVEMNFKVWFRLYFEILQVIESKSLDTKNSKFHNIDSIIITHGTDTLEESSFFIYLLLESMLCKCGVSVIFTGSMRTLGDVCSDVLSNLSVAFKVAISKDSKGVLVVFNDKIFSPKNVVKINMNDVNAFGSVNGGVMGVLESGGVKFFSENFVKKAKILSEFESEFKLGFLEFLKIETNELANFLDSKLSFLESKLEFIESSLPKVHILYAYADDNVGDLATFLKQKGAAGVVIAACGAGNISAKNKEILESLMDLDSNISQDSKIMQDSTNLKDFLCLKDSKNPQDSKKADSKNHNFSRKKLRKDSIESIKKNHKEDSIESINKKQKPFIVALSSRVLNGIIPKEPLKYLESNLQDSKIDYNAKFTESKNQKDSKVDSINLSPTHHPFLNKVDSIESNTKKVDVSHSLNMTDNLDSINHNLGLKKPTKFISTNNLNPTKSRILLTLLLTKTNDKDKIQHFFLEI
ncbi:hypothetical protein DCO58_07190 [Helicobacter saguini]|uniref:L-asparaginase N-terminal domain-containing protein n=1 Tax=Helicobacter saguini TaxID=1548018 RepID=A0A6B0HY37_9HELI|nr:hypothetical protein [Helicobacter saguini]MWV67443.1 hypothetical protein [Helicobacter saguini]MWV69796.1 hypothetical protein [Helicobacter saguini]MWV72987.1 hypothetical protein [Helicobacter saguini]